MAVDNLQDVVNSEYKSFALRKAMYKYISFTTGTRMRHRQ
jgi:hypothetical protein